MRDIAVATIVLTVWTEFLNVVKRKNDFSLLTSENISINMHVAKNSSEVTVAMV